MLCSGSFQTFAIAALLSTPTLASGIIGYGITMYQPVCAFACRDVWAPYPLACSSPASHDSGSHGHGHSSPSTTPECRANDTAFLTTLAWCMKSMCVGEYATEDWELEKYWQEKVTGDPELKPKWSYGRALAEVEGTPEEIVNDGEEKPVLNGTATTDVERWVFYRKTKETFEYGENMHSTYGIILLVVGFALPIVLSFTSTHLPIISPFIQRLKPYLIYPATIGKYQIRALPYSLGNAPTLGQSLFIAFFSIFSIIVSAVSYKVTLPSNIFADRWHHVMGLVAARTGVLAFALAPLTLLFAGRNNVLLFCTNWSYSTYILLHRWIARLFTLQVIAHSIAELAYYWDSHATEVKTEYWIWGIVATIACVIMVVISVLYFRRLSYEVFLTIHIILAVIVLVGSWFHVEFLFKQRWGYELWLYACFAVWGFDRLLRLFWVAKAGVLTAQVTEVTEDIVRIDIPDVSSYGQRPSQHAYVYFPTLRPWAPWENHPFSIIPSSAYHQKRTLQTPTPSPTLTSSSDPEKTANLEITPIRPPISSSATSTSSLPKNTPANRNGLTLYIRKEKGITAHLRPGPLTLLLEGPYTTPHTHLLSYPRLILITGGIGITATLPLLAHHSNVKLYWSVRPSSAGLVQDLEPVLSGAEHEVRVGERFDVAEVVRRDSEVWEKSGGVGVVVCGPGGLCDDVRAAVVAEGRKGREVGLVVEGFSW
ncbi:hypothetical protein BJ508DRAFT_222506, partial [Ascobolus immersus RN42]